LGQIPDLASLVVKTQIPESYLLRVSEGTRATVQFDAHDDLVLQGTVTLIGNVAIDRETSAGGAIVQTAGYSGQKVFEVTVSLDEVDPRLRPGITAQVRIVLDSREGVLTVPIEAVQREDEGTTVLLMNSEGRMETRRVTLGDHNGTDVIVLEGLQGGESIAVRRRPAEDSASGRRRPA
jgi:HlyD family secretion protein